MIYSSVEGELIDDKEAQGLKEEEGEGAPVVSYQLPRLPQVSGAHGWRWWVEEVGAGGLKQTAV